VSWRPPRTLQVLGKTVVVKQVTAEEMKDVVADNDGACGAWDCDTATIYVLRKLPPLKKQRAYWHEVFHCLIDLFDP
jgi:hypothetical protein